MQCSQSPRHCLSRPRNAQRHRQCSSIRSCCPQSQGKYPRCTQCSQPPLDPHQSSPWSTDPQHSRQCTDSWGCLLRRIYQHRKRCSCCHYLLHPCTYQQHTRYRQCCPWHPYMSQASMPYNQPPLGPHQSSPSSTDPQHSPQCTGLSGCRQTHTDQRHMQCSQPPLDPHQSSPSSTDPQHRPQCTDS